MDVIVPVPPSRAQKVQPVLELVKQLAKELQIPVRDVVQRKESPKELKNVFDFHERTRLLEGVHEVTSSQVRGKSVLLVDDLYRSGATLNAVTDTLYRKAGATVIMFLCTSRPT